MIFTIKNSVEQNIEVNDWVDLDSNYVMSDPNWGYSFQVTGFDSGYIMVNMLMPGTEEYASTAVSPSIVEANYRQVMPEEQ